MKIEIEEGYADISLYVEGKFIGSMKKPKNYHNLSKNKVVELFGKSK